MCVCTCLEDLSWVSRDCCGLGAFCWERFNITYTVHVACQYELNSNDTCMLSGLESLLVALQLCGHQLHAGGPATCSGARQCTGSQHIICQRGYTTRQLFWYYVHNLVSYFKHAKTVLTEAALPRRVFLGSDLWYGRRLHLQTIVERHLGVK